MSRKRARIARSLKYKNISSPMPNEVLFYIFAIFLYFVCIMALWYNIRGLRGTQGELFVCVCKWESFARSGWAQVKWIRNYNNIENNNNSGNAIGSTSRTNNININMKIKTSSRMYDAICWHCRHVMQCKVYTVCVCVCGQRNGTTLLNCNDFIQLLQSIGGINLFYGSLFMVEFLSSSSSRLLNVFGLFLDTKLYFIWFELECNGLNEQSWKRRTLTNLKPEKRSIC